MPLLIYLFIDGNKKFLDAPLLGITIDFPNLEGNEKYKTTWRRWDDNAKIKEEYLEDDNPSYYEGL